MVYSTRRLVLSIACVILFLSFSVLLVLRLSRLRKRELILVIFIGLFDLRFFGCLFPIPLGVWEGLRLVIVALLGLFSYIFCVRSLEVKRLYSGC